MTLGQPQSTLPIRQEIRSITGLRAFAAVAVYLNHFGLPGFSPDWLSNISTNGGLGVPFFFVLSGFVLALAYEDRPLIIRQFGFCSILFFCNKQFTTGSYLLVSSIWVTGLVSHVRLGICFQWTSLDNQRRTIFIRYVSIFVPSIN
jgi:peptidoglycan/LPS O-acetylase OafA/YrhL